jgi:hypothetical protein
MPDIKLLGKTRVGTKIKKVYDKNVISPYQRLLASPDISDEVKAELSRRFALYDPVRLQREVHNAVGALVPLNRKRGSRPPLYLSGFYFNSVSSRVKSVHITLGVSSSLFTEPVYLVRISTLHCGYPVLG